MKFFDKFKNEINENEKKKKLDKAKENAKNNLTEENRNNLRYLFASFFGIAALMSLSVSLYKLFFVYLFIGISILPIIYHNRFTENIDIKILRIIEVLAPVIIFILIVII